MEETDTLIDRIRTAVRFGLSKQEIATHFAGAAVYGISPEEAQGQVFLAYHAALLLESDND